MAWSIDSTGLEADHTHEYDLVDTPQQNSGRQPSWAASTGVRLSPVGVSSASYPVSNGRDAALPEMHLEGSQLSLAISPCIRHQRENEAPWKQFHAPFYGNLGGSPSAHHADQNEATFTTMNNSIQREPFHPDSSLRVPSNSANTATNHPWNTPDIRLTQKNDQPHG
ncbi:uncharacterized protein N7496_003392 [Penicillium cataractarum]|uniref:Uncharacterized protein n=1 Tax=Penicillium cataractarum TaxID=2100454 RepID=A0A9W9VHG7_9EURO|nr:uncharacterized protein N7496_003392 [Penicillium cataractarum]KAJ5380964.1 hypothetical protein N7496_003392 [Penicillium cataractarum]